jgi:hypothetical protein
VTRLVLVLALLAGCYRSKPPPRMTPIESPPSKPVLVQKTEAPLYTLEDVFADVTSTPLAYVGTGEWFGLFHVYSCVYKNAKVFVVNIYCTKTREKSAFGMVVLSRARGRAYLYAEAESKPISPLRRADYITFRFEAEQIPVDDKLPALSLDWSYAELRKWDETRYNHYPPGCFAGIEIKRPVNGCMQQLKEFEHTWPESHAAILANPPDVYYQLVNDFRTRAKREGRDWTK